MKRNWTALLCAAAFIAFAGCSATEPAEVPVVTAAVQQMEDTETPGASVLTEDTGETAAIYSEPPAEGSLDSEVPNALPEGATAFPEASFGFDGPAVSPSATNTAGVTDIYQYQYETTVDPAEIEAELTFLAANRPQMIIDCPDCGGKGSLPGACSDCGGSGSKAMKGVTMFAASVPCSSCRGTGDQDCPTCSLGGTINNPNYEQEHAEWTERRHELWKLQGYTDADIKQMEMEEAQAFIDARNGGSGSDSVTLDDDSGSSSVTGSCSVCHGAKYCPQCHGAGYLNNPYVSGQRNTCTACGGSKACWKCNGTGIA